MSICIFPGTFNPIHNGHLKMAEFAIEKYNFEKIIFIPSYIPPHKEVNKNLAEHRMNMVKLAVSGNPKFEVSDIEYLSDGKSYTLITVKKLIEQHKVKSPVNLLIGTDAFINLERWYKPEELKKLVHFIVFPRNCESGNIIYDKFKQNGWDFEVTDFECVDISSTEIRNAQKGKTQNIVEEYIKTNELYES